MRVCNSNIVVVTDSRSAIWDSVVDGNRPWKPPNHLQGLPDSGFPLITSKACPTQDSTLITPKACPTQDSRLITPKACPTQDSWSCYLLVLCYLLSLYFIAGISRWGPAAGGEALKSAALC